MVLFVYFYLLVYFWLYLEVFILDCIYKINKYKMFLFDIVGVDLCECFFCIVFVFLSGENEEDYIWVLE